MRAAEKYTKKVMEGSGKYLEQLPEGCPPSDAFAPQTGQIIFRLVYGSPPTAEDFRSYRSLHPDRKPKGKGKPKVDECQMCGLSVYTEQADLEEKKKLPRLRKMSVCLVILKSQSGLLKQTGRLSHHTRWPTLDFSIPDQCEVLEA